jgi:serine/threonine-protein kinase
VAVKVLAPFLANNDEYVARFFSESRNLRKLNHPNIVAAYDAGVEGEYKFFIMEYVDGVPLDRLMEQDERLPERRSLKIVRQVADALDYAWGRRIIHRDIKPSNIMIAHQRRVKLCDMGLSKDVTSDVSITMTDSINCSPPYASPEQAQGMKDLDCRSDIYSLGVVLFQMLVGDLPFNAESPGGYLIQHVTEPPPDPLDMNPELSPRTARLILRMLQKDPRERPTPGEVAVLIKKYLSGQARRL